jgi:hypothetical protein
MLSHHALHLSFGLLALAACDATMADGPPATPSSADAGPGTDPDSDAPEGVVPGVTAATFASTLDLGVNIERANAYHMGDFASGTEGFQYLRGLGFTHVRLFYAFRPTVNFGQSAGPGIAPTRAELSRIFPAIRNANAVGLKVVLDLTDVMGEEDFAGDYQQLVDGYLDMASKAIAEEGFDPAMLAVGAVNEWAGGSNASWNAQRMHVNAILRANLPGFVLVTGSANWKYHGDLMRDDFQLSDDPLMIYDVHAYEDAANDASHWTDLVARLGAWSTAHSNAQVLFGEAGFGNSFDGGPEVYYNVVAAAADHGQPIHPTFWAITDGNAWRMNPAANDYHLAPALEYILQLNHP